MRVRVRVSVSVRVRVRVSVRVSVRGVRRKRTKNPKWKNTPIT